MIDNKHNFAVIMAGGVGARFWPVSTSKLPKQYHDILGVGRTFIQQTFDRLSKLVPQENIFVITTEVYRDITCEQLPEVPRKNILAEPLAMNTAACNILAAKIIQRIDQDAVIIVAPSDHVILNETVFLDKAKLAMENAKDSDVLLTLGIHPTRPDTGYGYIRYKNKTENQVKEVINFTEKPNYELAKKFLFQGDYLWNAGIFIWSVNAIEKAFEAYLPSMYNAFKDCFLIEEFSELEKKIDEIYPLVEEVSVDVGILEKAQNVFVIPSDFGWSDLGTWTSVFENAQKDFNNNVIKSAGHHINVYDSEHNIIQVAQDKAVIISGLNDFIIVDTENALLICPKSHDQKIKQFVKDLKMTNGDRFI